MKIMFYGLNLNPPWVEGVRNTVRELALRLLGKGYDVHVFTVGSRVNREREEVDNIVYHRVPVASGDSYSSGGLSFILHSLWRLKKVVLENSIDIVHGHSSYPLIGVSEGLGLYGVSVLKVFTLYSRLDSTYGEALNYPLYTRFLLKLAKSYNLSRLIASTIDIPVCISPGIKETLPPGLREKTRIVPVGVDVEKFSPANVGDKFRREIGAEDSRVILMAGDVTPWKGGEVFIKASRIVKNSLENVKFVFLTKGTYEYEEERLKLLKTMVSSLRLDEHFVFLGRRGDINQVYAASDVVVFPFISIFAVMSIPLSLLEAMASGKPVIASNIGDFPYVIKDGFNGILVEPSNHAALASSILKVLGSGRLSRRLGRNARRTIVEKFSWEKVFEAYLKIYSDNVYPHICV